MASVAGLLCGLLEFHGFDPSSCLKNAGISPEQLDDPSARLSDEAVDRAWLYAQTVISDPCFGLHAHRCWHPSQLGALGYAWLASSSLRTALERLSRYARTVADRASVTVENRDRGLMVRLDAEQQQEKEIPAMVDATLTMIVDMCRVNSGETLDPVEVNLRRPPPVCAGRYFGYFRCPVKFDAHENNIILPLDAVDKRLPGANAVLARMHDQVLTDYLAHLDQSDIVARIQAEIIDGLPSGPVSQDGVARSLHMSERTLQRRLKGLDTSFGDILETTRRELALKYLQERDMSLLEISYLLGFADPSSFSRAFKRWTGQAPSEARQLS
ncbi:MAG: AraC family transcriptional regulator [Pseudomonadota bacterium]|nr:AraC family transcriptional regulator [Pseudomonadota bacterium]